MYMTIDNAKFHRAFHAAGRANAFSSEGLDALFEYLYDFPQYELDVIEICVEYVEYSSMEELQEDFPEASNCFTLNTLRNFLEKHTTIVTLQPDCIIIAAF